MDAQMRELEERHQSQAHLAVRGKAKKAETEKYRQSWKANEILFVTMSFKDTSFATLKHENIHVLP